MKRFAIAAAAILAVAGTILIVSRFRHRETPLWPGARHTVEERDRAVRRGLEFIYSIACDSSNFRDWGPDLLSAFENIATSNGSRELSELARKMGHERALAWRRLHPEIPAGADAADISNLVYGSDAAELLGAPDPAMHEALRKAAARFTPIDYLEFDPVREAPPDDIPEPCKKCGFQNARGARICVRDGTKLTWYTRYATLMDALISTYTGDQFGASIGGRYADVLHWLPSLRPYPDRHATSRQNFWDAIYAVTHIVYTYNGYNLSRVSPACFPQEFEYLKVNFPEALRDNDPETLGEYLDSLQAFGLTYSDPLIQQGIDYLLSVQNSDGSWGNPNRQDAYDRYHTTWTGIGGIQSFQWTRVLPCPSP
jgi:hypothetical protein